MNVTFADDRLDRLETDPVYDMGLSEALVKKYRMRLQTIRAALDERDFYAQKALHYEKLKGKRQHQRSMRLNSQFRLIVEVTDRDGERQVRIVGIEDYH